MADMYATQEKTFYVPRGQKITLTPTGTATVRRFSADTLIDTYTVTAARAFGAYHSDMRFRVYCNSGVVTIALSEDTDDPASVSEAFPYYHFHGYAGNQTAGDGKFFDLSGLNHGVRGANLSDAQMFGTAGYASTIDPSVGAADSTIHIPSLNFDYAGGEKLIVWWLGLGTPEAAAAIVFGDGYATTAGAHGFRMRMLTDGKYDLALIGDTSGFSGSSHAVVFDGTLHSLAFVFDGTAKTHGMWADDAINPVFGSSLAAFGSGTAFDTKTTGTVNIGAARPAAAASATAGEGAAIKTRALVIVRLPASYAMPPVSTLTTLFQQLRANPSKLILAGAL